MDMDKVIKGLEVCTSIADGESCPKDCPYYQEVCYGYDQLMRDALELLQAQRETIDELISADKALKLMKEQEAVVRCKDCAFYTDSANCPVFGMDRYDSWFCAGGERKET